jgi:hypothetical protein
MTVRAGYLHETSAVPLASTSVDFANWERDAISAGVSIALPRVPVTLDLAYTHHFLPDRTVTASRIAQVVTPCLTSKDCADPAATFVGNGTYRASLDVISASLRLALDTRKP